jgi:hypothetical protein
MSSDPFGPNYQELKRSDYDPKAFEKYMNR